MQISLGLLVSFLSFVYAINTSPETESHEGEAQGLIANAPNSVNKTIPVDGVANGEWDKQCNGCYRGQCWSYCWNGINVGKPWCYGSPTGSQDFNYQICATDADCKGNQCTYCAGSCTI